MCAQRLVNVRANAGEVREANHEAVGLASGWQVAKQFARQPRTVRGQSVSTDSPWTQTGRGHEMDMGFPCPRTIQNRVQSMFLSSDFPCQPTVRKMSNSVCVQSFLNSNFPCAAKTETGIARRPARQRRALRELFHAQHGTDAADTFHDRRERLIYVYPG